MDPDPDDGLALAPRIRVNAIGPGPTMPNARQSAAQFLDASRHAAAARHQPSRDRAGDALILDAPAMTGQMIALDGGSISDGHGRGTPIWNDRDG